MLTRSAKLIKNALPMSRMFSSNAHLLVPLETKPHPPSEVQEGFPLTKHYFTQLAEEYEQYNQKCKNDLQ